MSILPSSVRIQNGMGGIKKEKGGKKMNLSYIFGVIFSLLSCVFFADLCRGVAHVFSGLDYKESMQFFLFFPVIAIMLFCWNISSKINEIAGYLKKPEEEEE